MSTRKVRTKEDEEKVDAEFASLLPLFRPQFGVLEDINMMKRIGTVLNYERLMKANKGKKGEGAYRSKVYDGKKNLISSLNYYLKNKNT